MTKRFLLFSLLLTLATPAVGQLPRILAANLPACSNGSPRALYLIDATTATDCDSTGGGAVESFCSCQDGTWYGIPTGLISPALLAAVDAPADEECLTYEATGATFEWQTCGAGGSGDIEAVWACTTGNCDALTAEAGDTMDASLADTTIPWRVDDATDPTNAGEVAFQPSNRRIAVGLGASTIYFNDTTQFAQQSFVTINAPSGTDPAADSVSDTLNLTSGATALSITGDSTTDTVTFDIAGTASRCARFDGSGELVTASADCSSGDTDTKITLDLGDDGGNDSTALNEIATVGDAYSVVTEPSADKAKIDFGKVPPYQAYDPMMPMTGSGAFADEEWLGDADSLSWSWGNQGTATSAYGNDCIEMTVLATGGTSTHSVKVYMIAAPATGDFMIGGRILDLSVGGSFESAAIGVLVGSLATPTRIVMIGQQMAAANQSRVGMAHYSNYTTFGADLFTTVQAPDYSSRRDEFFALVYTDSSKNLDGYSSPNGKRWNYAATYTLAARPDFVGVVGANNTATTTAYFAWDFFRVTTTSSSFPAKIGNIAFLKIGGPQ